MTQKSGESGLDALMRLSRETARQAQDLEDMEKQRAEQRERSQSVRQGLRGISVSVAVGQLEQVASKEILEEIKSLVDKQDNRGLRKLITDLVHDLERHTGNIAAVTADPEKVQRSVKTLAIMLELYFALSD
ncbi:hypothetical protein ACFLYQ_06480 [Chloroflexota bacterium]